MKIVLSGPPDPDILRDRKKYALWFSAFLVAACVSVGVAAFAVYLDTHHGRNLDNWVIAALVGSSLGITWFGNRLQAYKKLYPPHRKKLVELRAKHPEIENYCAGVEASGRELIRAEYEACIAFSEKYSAVPFS